MAAIRRTTGARPLRAILSRHSAAAADASHLGVDDGVLVSDLVDIFGAFGGRGRRPCGGGRPGCHPGRPRFFGRRRRLIVVTGELCSCIRDRAAVADLGRSGSGQRADRTEDGNQSHFNSTSDPEVSGYRRASRQRCGHIRDTFARPRSATPWTVVWRRPDGKVVGGTDDGEAAGCAGVIDSARRHTGGIAGCCFVERRHMRDRF
jgi:hypothetical protein